MWLDVWAARRAVTGRGAGRFVAELGRRYMPGAWDACVGLAVRSPRMRRLAE